MSLSYSSPFGSLAGKTGPGTLPGLRRLARGEQRDEAGHAVDELQLGEQTAERGDRFPLQQFVAGDDDEHVVFARGEALRHHLVVVEFGGIGAEQLGERIVDAKLGDAEESNDGNGDDDGADDGRIAERGQTQPLQPEAQGSHAFWFGFLLHFPLIRSCYWRGYSKDRAPALAAGSNQMGEIRLEIERGLHLPQLLEARLGLVADIGLGRVGDVLFGVLDGLSQHIGVELGKVDRGLG